MLACVRQRLSVANVLSLLAVFVVLGGGAYAADKITGKDVKKDALGGKQIKEKKLKPVCPKNASNRIGDVCYGDLQGPAGWDPALDDCAAEGLRAPTIAEAMLSPAPRGGGDRLDG
jgi:hypothetical protein